MLNPDIRDFLDNRQSDGSVPPAHKCKALTAERPAGLNLQKVEPPGSERRILRLTVARRWFDMIARGEKKEEYRTPSAWINSRVNSERDYDAVEFRNGYRKDCPTVTVEYLGFRFRTGREDWGGDPCKNHVVILLGKIIPPKGARWAKARAKRNGRKPNTERRRERPCK